MSEKKKIIIVDDFQLLREDLCELINSQPDMEVAGTADSGSGAVALASGTRHDMILMDIEMETVSAGIAATERILEENPMEEVIFLTAHESKEVILSAMGAGAKDYIVKGCSDEEMMHHIRCALSGNPVMANRIQETVMAEYARLRKSERSLLYFIHNISKLTSAERELVRLLLQEYKVNEIASLRCVETCTVKTQIKTLLRKFGCSRTKEIVNNIRGLNIAHLF